MLEEQNGLYTKELVETTRDILWQFRDAHEKLEALLSACSRGYQRLKIVFRANRIKNAQKRMKGLARLLSLAMQVLNMAKTKQEDQFVYLSFVNLNSLTSTQIIWGRIIRLEVNQVQTLIKQSSSMVKAMRSPPPRDEGGKNGTQLLTSVMMLERKSEDFANWMALTLAAPHVPLSQIATSSRFSQSLTMPGPRPHYNLEPSNGAVSFRPEDISTDVLDDLKIEWKMEYFKPVGLVAIA